MLGSQVVLVIYLYLNFTHHLVRMGVLNVKVVNHFGVEFCQGTCWGVVVWWMPHWTLHSDDGIVVLASHRNQRWAKGSYTNSCCLKCKYITYKVVPFLTDSRDSLWFGVYNLLSVFGSNLEGI